MDKNRANNVIWTVSGDYSFIPNMLSIDFYNNSKREFYNYALLGLAYKVYNMDLVYKFLRASAQPFNNRNDLYLIAYLVIEESLYRQLLVERPGLEILREDFYKDLVYHYQRIAPKNLSEELEFGYYRRKLLKPVISFPTVSLIIDKIEEARHLYSTYELLHHLEKIYKNYFHVDEYLPNYTDIDSILSNAKREEENPEESRIKPLNKYKGSKNKNLEQEVIESAEFTDTNVYDAASSKESPPNLLVEDRNDNKTYNIIETQFGKNSLPLIEINSIERSICTGIHKDIHLHFTEGQYKSDMKSHYFKDLIDMNREENIKYYEDNIHLHKRSIIQLKEIIKNTILSDMDSSTKRSSSGNIIPSKIYRQIHLNDPLIFEKTFKEEYGTLSVDILLDSSGSQEEHASKVVTQGYIIVSALTELNIPTRVLGFNNLFNYLSLKKYRDYNDDISKNSNIFNFYPTGSNRDGLAIKYVRHSLKEKNIDNKLFIVLSDGRPNDKIEINSPGYLNLDSSSYELETALLDTAKEVLKCKMEGIKILGVFTGHEEDLDNEKLIYSNDFAYITNINRFSSIVGLFLKSLIDRD